MENSIIFIKNINEILCDIDMTNNQFMQNMILEKHTTLFITFMEHFTEFVQAFLFDNDTSDIDINYIIENGITNNYSSPDYHSTLFCHNIYLILKNISVFNHSPFLAALLPTILHNLVECEKSFIYLLSNELSAKNIFLATNYLKHKMSFVLAIKKNSALKHNHTYSSAISVFKEGTYFQNFLSQIFNEETTKCLDIFFDIHDYKLKDPYSHSNFHQLLKDLDSLLVLVSFTEDEHAFLKNFINVNFLEKIDEFDSFEKEVGLVPVQKNSLLKKILDSIINLFRREAY